MALWDSDGSFRQNGWRKFCTGRTNRLAATKGEQFWKHKLVSIKERVTSLVTEMALIEIDGFWYHQTKNRHLGPYSPTILKNALSLVLQIFFFIFRNI